MGGITQLFLAAISLVGVLMLPSTVSAHDEDDNDNRRLVAKQEFYKSSYINREHLQLQRSLRRNYQDQQNRYSYNDDHPGNRWYNEHERYGKKYYQSKSCQLPRRTYGNGRRYHPRYYGNDYYGYTR